ncbi:DUF3429 domain-containing protein [Sandarakinorhabdus sp.]|uniref:DUF3429 domain-containing protein n=1 Tax=Sandarakinorhabdus sp. TaxID=1916663 RepID=UPI003341985B
MITIPRAVLFFGLAGLIPFFAAPVLTLLFPDFRWQWNEALLSWSAIILSFLGGARWGAAVQAGPAPARLIGLAMLPSIGGWFILLMPANTRAAQFIAFAVALLLMLAWDWRGRGLPGWYRALRLPLTAGAAVALGWQALLQG